MRKISKILSIILSLIMIITVIPFTVNAEAVTGTCGENLTWEFDNSTGTLTVSGTGAMSNFTSGNCPWKSYVNEIKKVCIANGVTTIGNYAFMNCVNLESVVISKAVTTIGIGSFSYCQSIETITIPCSVASINLGAFAYCFNLSDIIVDSNNQYYSSDEYGVLFNKDKTTLIQYPIGNPRTDYVVPESVLTIGDISFAYSQKLVSVTISDGVTKIGDGAFAYCERLADVTIPDSMKTIGGAAFDYCEDFTDIYYSGSAEEWDEISINNFNETLFNVKIHYDYHKHNYASVIIAPTCTEQGYTTYTCNCGDRYVKYAEATGHQDAHNDGICDNCEIQLCDHSCHKEGITGFFWRIVNVFNMLFGLNKTCECGVAHY